MKEIITKVYCLMYKERAWRKDDPYKTAYNVIEPDLVDIYATEEEAVDRIRHELGNYDREGIFYVSGIRTLPGTKDYNTQSKFWITLRHLIITENNFKELKEDL